MRRFAILSTLILTGSAAFAGPLPVVDLYDVPVQSLATESQLLDQFQEICIAPQGAADAELDAMERLDFVEIKGAISGKYMSWNVQLGTDLKGEADRFERCSIRWVTEEPLQPLETKLGLLDLPSGKVGVQQVTPLDGTFTDLRKSGDRANSRDPKVIVLYWSATN